MAVEVEDDVFFADLSRQIALLIMDDEEEFPVQSPPLPVQELPYVPHVMMATMMPPHYSHEASYPRESKGTGVFIPRSAVPRRKNKSRRPPSSVDNSKSSFVASRDHAADAPKQLHGSRRPNHVLKRHM